MTDDVNSCNLRIVTAPDGRQIPVPSGGLGLSGGSTIIRDDASVQITPSDNGYYVVVNNADPSNSEASDLFGELTVEGGISAIEHLAAEAFAEIPTLAFKAAGLVTGVLVSLFTSSKLTQEVFIRSSLPDDGTGVTYCLLL